jgi:hypothetical protein
VWDAGKRDSKQRRPPARRLSLLGSPNEAQSQNLRYPASRRARSAAASTPSTRTSLSRALAPRTTLTREAATPARAAISRQSASLARPSTGGAVTRTA